MRRPYRRAGRYSAPSARRRTAERIDLEAGVVRDGGLPRRAGHGDGLQIGVFLEGLAGLVDLKVAAGRALRDDLDAHVGKDGAKLI